MVTGYALRPPTEPALFEIARIAERMKSVIGDVRDLSALQGAVRNARPEIMIHMAAQPLVRRSYEAPVETYATNVMGTVHLLEAARQVPDVRAVVVITSDKCYENREWVWPYRENEAMGGFDPYSSSKGCAELVTAAYRSSFFNPQAYAQHGVAVATARAGNVIGGGDWAKNRLVPDVLAAFQVNKPALIRNPQAIRPWQHVLEPLSGYLVLAERLHEDGGAYADAWNFGPSEDDAEPVAWVAEQLAELWGRGAQWRTDDSSHPHEANYLKLDSSKARARLNWHPRLTLVEALQLTVAWARAVHSGEDSRARSVAQIQAYQSTASRRPEPCN